MRQGEPTLAVVKEDGQFVGVIPPQRLIEILLAEHDEDLARFGGFLGTQCFRFDFDQRQLTLQQHDR